MSAKKQKNEELNTLERFYKNNPDFDGGITYYDSESFQRKQRQKQYTEEQYNNALQQKFGVDTSQQAYTPQTTTQSNRQQAYNKSTPLYRSPQQRLAGTIANKTQVKKYEGNLPKYTPKSGLTKEETNDYRRREAIKAEYESIPERNALERYTNWFTRTNASLFGALPEDYPNYREEYNRKQALSSEYRRIKNDEAIADLFKNGFTQEDLLSVNEDVLTQEDIDRLVAEGKTEEEIEQIAQDLFARGENTRQRLYDYSMDQRKNTAGLSYNDYINAMEDYYANPAVKELAKRRPVMSSVESLFTNPVESLYNVGASGFNYLSGKPIENNPTTADIMREGVNERIGNRFGQIAYSGAMSIGDMAIAQGIDFALGGGGIISAGLQAAEKASQVSNDAVERGLTPNRIFASSIASGVTTFVTEKISMGRLSDIAEHGLTNYSAKEIAKTLGAAFVTEGAQEGMEDVADWITGSLISWDKNEFNQAYQSYLESGESEKDAVRHVISDKLVELISDVVMGGIGGGVMGGANTGLAYAAGKIQTNPHVDTDLVLESDAALNQLVEAVQTIDTTKLSEEDAQRVEHAKEVSQKPSDELTVEDVVDMSNVVNEQAGPDNNLAQTIQEINYQANYENNINEYLTTGKIEEKTNELPIERQAREQAQLAVKDFNKAALEQQKQAERNFINELKSYKKNDWQSDAEVKANTEQRLDEASAYFENDTAAKNFKDNYNGQSLDLYTEVSYLAYTAGESGQSFDTFLKNSAEANLMIKHGGVDKGYLKTLFYNGQNARTTDNEEVTLIKNKNRGLATNLSPDDQLATLKKAIAKKLNIEVATNFEDAESRGNFMASVARLVTNSTSDNEYATIIHEMFEFARSYNAKGMELVDRTLTDMIVKKKGERSFVDAVNRYKETYRRAGKNAPEGSSLKAEANKTFSEAQEEFVNDAASYIFSTEEGMKNLIDYIMDDGSTTAQEKMSAIQTIKAWVDDLIRAIKNFLSGHPTDQLGYKYTERLKLTSAELQNISQMLVGALEGARANLEAMTEQKGGESEKVAHQVEVPAVGNIEMSTDELNKNLHTAHNMKPIEGIEFYDYKMKPISEGVPELMSRVEEKGKTYANVEVLGKVDITNNGIKDILRHSKPEIAGSLIDAVIPVLENGKIVYADYDHKNKNYNTATIVAPVTFSNDGYGMNKKGTYYVAVIVKRSPAANVRHQGLHVTDILTIRKGLPKTGQPNNGVIPNAANLNLNDILNYVAADVNIYGNNNKVKFSLDVPVEETDDLIAVHNLYDEKLKGILELGGFPMPSIAITKANMAHEKFGNISVLFRRDTIDPKKSKANKVYSGDAYTPTFPRMGYKVNEKKAHEIYNRLQKILGDEMDAFGYLGIDTDNITEYLERNNGDAVEAYYNKEALKYAYAKDSGIKFDAPMKESSLSWEFDNDEIKYIALMFTPEEALRIHQNASESYKEFEKDGRLQKIIDKINAVEKKTLGKFYENHKTTEMSFADFDSLINSIVKYNREGIKQEIDRAAFSKEINNVLDGKEESYRKWLEDLFDGVISKKGIRNNKDPFTPSGSRRSWDSLHDEYNLTNIVKAMKGEPEVGQSLGGYTLLGSINRQFDSIEDIHSEENRLKFLSDDEYMKLRGEIQDDVFAVAKKLVPNPGYDVFSICSDIAEAAAKRKTRSGIKSFLSEWYDVSEEDMDEIMRIIRNAKELPTGYFEAKPQRAVGFDEVAAVVIPSDDEEMIRLCEEKGLPVVTYERGDKGSRLKAVNSVENIKFSLDVKYDEAYENNDISEMDKLVKQAAREAGYDSPMLYHGTMDFGFTQIDLDKMDDKMSFFATDNLSIASSYSGTNNARGINEKEVISLDKIPEMLKDLHRWKDIREFREGDEESRYEYLREKSKSMYNFAKQNERDLRERGIMEAYSDFMNTLAEQMMFKQIDLKTLNQKLRPLQEAHYVISDYAHAIHNAYLLLGREGLGMNAYMLDGIPKSEREIRQNILPGENQGIYKFYANTDKMLTINGKGQNWNGISGWQSAYAKSFNADNTTLKREGDIVALYSDKGIKLASKKTSEDLTEELKKDLLDTFRYRLYQKEYGTSTRQISAFAKNEGYDGVIIKDITDDGGRSNNFDHYVERGDIYIFYKPQEQVKSADTVTYDDEGNVIPLSERFKADNNDIRYSIAVTEDSTGKELSKGQQEFFKDSKIRDEEGRLLRLYHGSMANFTVFDIGEARDSEDIEAFFFSPNAEEAEGYGNTREFYLNITNPADFDTAYNIFFKHRKENPAGAGARAREELISLGYDGVAAIDSSDPEYPEYLAFYPEQIKLVSNTKPTKNKDIRYSLKVTDTEGHELTKGQQKYFKNSKIVDENGRLKVMYHGSLFAGFTVFDPKASDDKISLFFSDNPEVSRTYTNTLKRFNPDSKWTFETLKDFVYSYSNKNAEAFEENGKIEIENYRTGHTKTFNSVAEAQKYFVDEYLTDSDNDTDRRGIYEVYLNAENPLIVDADGEYWNSLPPVEFPARHLYDVDIQQTSEGTEISYEEDGVVKRDFSANYKTKDGYIDIDAFYNKYGIDIDEQTKLAEHDYLYIDDIFLSKDGERVEEYGKTRDYTKYAKEHGYDSVIFKNIIDYGKYGKDADENVTSDVVVVFNSNQVKSIYNENPTKNEDIRYSIDVSGDGFFDSFLEIDEEVKKTESALKEMIDKRMDLDSDISKKMISDVASYIRNKYNSTYKKEWLESSITAIFKFLQNNNVRMEDIMYIMSDIAKPILENVKNSDPEQEKLYKDIIKTVKSYKIKLDAGQKQEVINAYGSYKNFVKSMRGKITLSNDGIALDNIWTELVDKTGGSLSYGTVPNDQPIELANLINGLNPTYASLEGQALEDAAMDVALDIISQFYVQNSMTEAAKTLKGELTKRANKVKEEYKKRYNEALKQVEAEKALNAQRLAEDIDNLTAEEQEAIRMGDTVNQVLIENLKKEYKARYERLQAQANEKIAKARATYQNSWTNKNIRRQRSELKNRVLREVKALQNILAHPAEGASKHVPVNLIKPTIEMLEAINLDNGGRNKAIADRLKKMAEVYESFKNDERYSFDYDERIAEDIKELQQMFNNKSYADLGITELQRVIEIVTALKTQIKNANNLILQGKREDARKAADEAINEVKGSRRHDNAAMNALNRYGNLHLNAYRLFRKLSGYIDGSLMDIYNDLDEGSKKEMQIQKDLGAIFQDVLAGQKNQKEVKRFISTKDQDLVDIGITDKNGKPIKITRAMRMSLIMHSMNASNMRHVLGSGITIPNMDYFAKGKMDEAYAKGTNYRFVDYAELLDAIQRNDQKKINELTTKAQERIENLKKDLSTWEKQFLRDAEKMFHEETGKLINETSMALKGYALARVKNYFPIRTDRHFTQQEWAGLVQNGSLEGMGMLKERVISTKPILLEDITNVIQRQIRSVSKYAGLAVPVRNFETIMKQTFRDQSDGQLHNLYETIDSVWGSSDTNWLKNLMQDIQGGRSEKGNFLMNLRGQFAGATLTLNPSVAIKQAASYPTAAAVVGWKPLGRAVADMRKGFITGQGIKELEDINPLLWYRNQGNATQELADAKAVGFGKNLPLWAQKAVNWTQWFDTGTVRTLEYASKYYVDDNFKNLKEGTEAYWQKVSEIFTNVVEQTQPNYSTLHKADIIRNPYSIVKMLVMFKTQPMQNFGIIYDAMGELNAAKVSGNKRWVKEASSKAAMAISSQAVSATVFSAMTILSQLLLHRWWKYRDDEEWSWEKFWLALGEGALSCLTGAFIGGSELYEALKHILTGSSYYGIEISVAEMVNDFVENTGNITKNAKALWEAKTSEDREKATQKLLKSSINLGATIGEFKGTPINNIKNMLSAMYFYATDIIRSIDEGELTFSDDSNIATWDIKNQYERIYEALQNNDTEKYNKLVQEVVDKTRAENPDATDDEIAEKVEKKVSDSITDLMKADYLEGNITDEEMMDYLMEEKGKSEEDAFFTVRGWDTGESKYGVLTNGIDEAASDPTPENRQAVNNEIKLLLEHGVEKKDIASKITSTYKAQYIELYNQNKAADLNSILRSALVAAGYTDEEAKKKLEGWLK